MLLFGNQLTAEDDPNSIYYRPGVRTPPVITRPYFDSSPRVKPRDLTFPGGVVRQGNRAYPISPINRRPKIRSAATDRPYEPPSSLVREGNRAIPCQTIYEDTSET